MDYEKKILECLKSSAYGLTVTGISKKLGASRNTVYRYLDILEGKDVIFKKEIGRYNLYFSKEARAVSRDIISSFYKGLLVALNDEFPEDRVKFKEFGKTIAKHVNFPYEVDDLAQLMGSEELLKKEFIEVLGVIRPYFSLLHDKISLKDIDINEKERKLLFHFVNSDMLEEIQEGINHFYLLAGFLEEKVREKFGLNVRADILEYEISEKDGENYIDVSLTLER